MRSKIYILAGAFLLGVILIIIFITKTPKKDLKVSSLTVYFVINKPVIEGKESRILKIGDKIKTGDTVKTDKDSIVGLTDENNSFRIIVEKESKLYIESIEKMAFELKEGKTFDYIDKKINFYKKTPTVTAGVRGTKFVTESDGDKSIIKLAEGQLYIKRNIQFDKPVSIEEETLNELESVSVSVEENKKIKSEMESNIQFKIPPLKKVKISKDDKDILQIKSYNSLRPNLITILFDFNKANIKKEFMPVLEKTIYILKNNPNYSVKIEGHSDDKGKEKTKQWISDLRAKTIAEYFVKNGINKERINYIGLSDKKPVLPNISSKNRMENRRVEIYIIQNNQ